MISVIKDFSIIFPFNKTFLESVLKLNQLVFNDNYYNHDKVKKELNDIYGNKCAYCESLLEISGYKRIDHYRPKEKIKDIHGNKLNNHKGYFWLAYEWSNLVPCCEICNGAKSDYFPLLEVESRVSDFHIDIPFPTIPPDDDWKEYWQSWRECWNPMAYPLSNEKRLLLNPELDEVEKYFYYMIDGRIQSDEIEGIISIKIYDLNREPLQFERKKVIDLYYDKLLEYIDDYLEDKNEVRFRQKITGKILEKVIEKDAKEDKFHGLKNYMILNFENIFLRNEILEKKLIKEIYKTWLLA